MPVLCMLWLLWKSVGGRLSMAHHQTLHSATFRWDAWTKLYKFGKPLSHFQAAEAHFTAVIPHTIPAQQKNVFLSQRSYEVQSTRASSLVIRFHRQYTSRAVRFPLLLWILIVMTFDTIPSMRVSYNEKKSRFLMRWLLVVGHLCLGMC